MRLITVIKKHITHGLVTAMVFMAVLPAFAQPGWEVNSSQFEFTMTVTGIATINCEESVDTNDIIGAFVGNEVRGVQHVRENFNGHLYAFLLVYDNQFSGNEVTFRLYDASEDSIITVLPTVVFQENKSVGSTEQPFIFQTAEGITDIQLSQQVIGYDAKPNDVICELSSFISPDDETDASYLLVNDALGVHNSSFSIVGDQLILLDDPSAIGGTDFTIHLSATPGQGCSWEKVFHLQWEQTTALKEIGLDDYNLNVFPNPGNGSIQWTSSRQWKYAYLYDLQGRRIATRQVNNNSADFSGVRNGTYTLWLSDHTHLSIERITIID